MRPLPSIGSDFAGYHIESLLSRGGMAEVYLARHLLLGRRVALKLLSPELIDDDTFRERFDRESKQAAAIDHPNNIPIYEAGEVDGVLFIAMRYVAGSDLKVLLRRQGRLDLARTLSITVCFDSMRAISSSSAAAARLASSMLRASRASLAVAASSMARRL